MVYLICTFITLATFFFWEYVAYWTHKYVMHGFLWTWHKSHHTRHNHLLEKNDLFGLVFSLPSIALFMYGIHFRNPYIFSIALGILLYGLFYLLFHDFIVHQRIRWRPSRRTAYLNRMINAHYVHHSRHSKDGCEAFGFLIVPERYSRSALQIRKKREETQ